MNKKALIAMSGGVDSSVAAYLMKSRGFDCSGITMRMFGNDGNDIEKSCGSRKEAEDAENIAQRLDIPFYVLDCTEEFAEEIIARFIESYQSGATPNPCVDCNRYIKFEKLYSRVKRKETDYIVTGHYAQVEYDESANRYLLKKGADDTKDQSYVLYSLTQEQLAHTIFPLGGLRKSEVRRIAAEQGFINADKRDSQDICFVRDNDYAGFIERYTNKTYVPLAGFEDGDFIDMSGKVLGRHRGLIRYTVGQRKGLGLALEKPMYVHSKSLENNTVTLCENEGLFTKSLNAVNFNWIAYDKPDKPVRVKAKVRYRQTEQWAVAEQISDSTVRIEFDEPQRAIAKGQAVVLYDGDVVVGGGTIM